MSLKVWNAASDPYDHEQLADNFLKLDQHDHSQGRGVPIGSAGIRAGAITSEHLAFVPFAAPAYVTTLPAFPYDGQEIYYQNSGMATAGAIWHLKYRAASASAYKWEMLGGQATRSTVSLLTVASTSYVNATGVVLTAPLAGDYHVTVSARMQSGFAGFNTGLISPGGDTYAAIGIAGQSGAISASPQRTSRITYTAGATVQALLRVYASGVDFYEPQLTLMPYRVG